MASLQIGKLLEHMDTIAGAAAYAHSGGLPSRRSDGAAGIDEDALTIVTAGVDRIDMLGKVRCVCARARACVQWGY